MIHCSASSAVVKIQEEKRLSLLQKNIHRFQYFRFIIIGRIWRPILLPANMRHNAIL